MTDAEITRLVADENVDNHPLMRACPNCKERGFVDNPMLSNWGGEVHETYGCDKCGHVWDVIVECEGIKPK